jgi:hypothetical protein
VETVHRNDRNRCLGYLHKDIFHIQMQALERRCVYGALMRSKMTYVCPTSEFAAGIHLVKLQRLQNRVLRALSDPEGRTPVRDFRVAFKIPYVYEYITKLCRRQVKVIQDHQSPNVLATGQGNTKGLNLAAARPTTVQVSNCRFGGIACCTSLY